MVIQQNICSSMAVIRKRGSKCTCKWSCMISAFHVNTYVCVLKGLMNVHEPYDIKGSSVCSWVQWTL